ncbi:hypothetical protein ACQEVY_26435 [Streptomyces sp. CA-288835]|uniref:hypothetical protein n=1 Tax=Streptomyces sp. CA-288835 TaxID=3240069 RepID=UPI003D919483
MTLLPQANAATGRRERKSALEQAGGPKALVSSALPVLGRTLLAQAPEGRRAAAGRRTRRTAVHAHDGRTSLAINSRSGAGEPLA